MTNKIEVAASIKVFGIGGGGGNAINRMIEANIQGVEFYAVNTDAQALKQSKAKNKIAIGSLGAGSKPEVGRQAAEDNETEIRKAMQNADLVYITAGMGGGTGTGAAPVFARIAKELNILTIAIVTKPFKFEGNKRAAQAIAGIEELKKYVDSLIIVSNNKLLEIFGDIPIPESFKQADNVLRQGVQVVTDLINVPSMINLDFADVKTVMKDRGDALIGIGMGNGENGPVEAAKKALECPLLESKAKGAKNAIVNITGGPSVSIKDANTVVEYIKNYVGTDLDIIFGIAVDESLKDKIVVTVIMTGLETYIEQPIKKATFAKTMVDDHIPAFFENRKHEADNLIAPEDQPIKPIKEEKLPTFFDLLTNKKRA